MKSNHTISVFVLAATTLLSTGDAFAQRVAFFRHQPREDLASMTAGKGSRTLTAADLDKARLDDLLEFDVLYIEGTGPGFEAALRNRMKIAVAVSLGLGLYVVGTDPALFEVVPTDVSLSAPIATGETRIPPTVAWHPVASIEFLSALARGQSGSVLRAFSGLPEGYIALQEVRLQRNKYLPTIMLGSFGSGRIVLRTTDLAVRDESSVGNTVAMSLCSWISDGIHADDEIAAGATQQLASSDSF
jgi:hypothetical protein